MSDPLKSKVGAADPNDASHAKYVRNLRSTDQLMRQFLKLETGLGNSPEFQRGWTWNFLWNSDDSEKARPVLVAAVNELMRNGFAFEEAFDRVVRNADRIERESKEYDDAGCDGSDCGHPCSVCKSGAYGSPCPDYEYDEESTTRRCPDSVRKCVCGT